MDAKVQIYRRRNWRGKLLWYWRVRARNGRIVAVGGEGYVDKSHAKDMAGEVTDCQFQLEEVNG
jgi:uncharacterized protein YegP (UPF0339 family)